MSIKLQSIKKTENELIINSITIRQLNGLFSINDLFRASGAPEKHSPKRWARLKRTKALIKALDLSTVKRSIKSDRKAGTFVCRELVYAYAMHISPDFEITVIKFFDRYASKQRQLAEIRSKAEWQEARALGKTIHRHNTDIIKTFLTYAQAQGSKNYPTHGYTIFAKMVNKALCINDRGAITEETLHALATAETICDNALCRGMRDNLPYKVIYKEVSRKVHQFAEMVVSDA